MYARNRVMLMRMTIIFASKNTLSDLGVVRRILVQLWFKGIGYLTIINDILANTC